MMNGCVKCGQQMRNVKQGIYVVLLDGEGNPYQIWCADLMECGTCHTQVTGGYGQNAFKTVRDADMVETIATIKKNCPDYLVEIKW